MIKLASSFEKENLLDDEASKGKCLMAQIVKPHVDTSNDNVGTLNDDPSQAATDFKLECDTTSLYQLKCNKNWMLKKKKS